MSNSETDKKNLEQKLDAMQKEVETLRSQNSDLEERLTAYSLINTGQTSLINKLIDRVPFGIVLLDENYVITHANDAAGKIFSSTASKMSGKSCEKYFQPYKMINGHLEGKHGEEVTLQEVTSGEAKKTIMHSAFISDEGSKKITVETFIDITEIKQAEQELININQAKDEFLGLISHELRTPLNVIQGYSSLLEDELANSENTDAALYVKNITDSGELLLHLVNNLLELSNLTAGKVHIDVIPIDVQMIVTQLKYRLEKDYEKNNNKLIVNCEQIAPFEQDLALLMKILYELLVNANKFTKDGEIILSIFTCKKDRADWLSFKVSDTGCGMTNETMEQIFDAFHQADASLTRSHEGLGLGLSIVEKMVNIINGYIDVESELEKGTSFIVSIPFEPVGAA